MSQFKIFGDAISSGIAVGGNTEVTTSQGGRALIKLSMYVDDDEWNSAMRLIPASERMSVDEARREYVRDLQWRQECKKGSNDGH